jgi:CRP-like cAMP-binding protein
MRTIAELLDDSPVFSGLEPARRELIAGCGVNVRLSPGEILFRQGDPADAFYVIRHGAVALEIAGVPARPPLVIETLHDGEVVGWSWLVPPHRWSFDARVLEPTAAVKLDGACLRGKAQADPSFGYELMLRFSQVMVERLQATRMRLMDVYGDPRAA